MALDTRTAELAVDLGALAAAPDPVAAAPVALDLLRSHLHAVAGQLDTRDPAGRWRTVASAGYTPDVSRDLCTGLTASPFGARVLRSRRPVLIDDAPHDFRGSAHFREHLRPAGFDEGMSLALRDAAGRLTGMVHLSAAAAGDFGPDGPPVLRALGRTLAPLTDLTALAAPGWALPREFAAVQLRPSGAVLPVPDRPPTPHVADPVVLALAAAFRAAGAAALDFSHPRGCGVDQVRLVRLRARDGEARVGLASRPHPAARALTPRELDVLTGLATGVTNRRIAAELHVSERTVACHVERVLGKLGAGSRAGAAAVAVRDGLLRPSPDPGSVRALRHLVSALPPEGCWAAGR